MLVTRQLLQARGAQLARGGVEHNVVVHVDAVAGVRPARHGARGGRGTGLVEFGADFDHGVRMRGPDRWWAAVAVGHQAEGGAAYLLADMWAVHRGVAAGVVQLVGQLGQFDPGLDRLRDGFAGLVGCRRRAALRRAALAPAAVPPPRRRAGIDGSISGQTLVLRLLRCGVRHCDRRVELRRGVPARLLIELVVALVVACETVPRGGCGDVAAQRGDDLCVALRLPHGLPWHTLRGGGRSVVDRGAGRARVDRVACGI